MTASILAILISWSWWWWWLLMIIMMMIFFCLNDYFFSTCIGLHLKSLPQDEVSINSQLLNCYIINHQLTEKFKYQKLNLFFLSTISFFKLRQDYIVLYQRIFENVFFFFKIQNFKINDDLYSRHMLTIFFP